MGNINYDATYLIKIGLGYIYFDSMRWSNFTEFFLLNMAILWYTYKNFIRYNIINKNR